MNIDKRIAEEVMGKPLGWGNGKDGYLGFRHFDDLPKYSTNIADAWQVVERCKLDFSLEKTSDDRWHCFYGGGTAFADTPSMAICLAALESK